MKENVKIIEINNVQDLVKINPDKVHCVYLGDDCVYFKAFALENDNIVCYEVSDEVKEEVIKDKLSEIFSFHPYEYHYLGMGHNVRMREEYYKPFKRRIKNAKFFGYRESYEILFDLMKNKNFDLTDEEFADIVKSVVLGHAVGDALGVPVEFKSRELLDNAPVTDMDRHPFIPLPKGSWSDDTSMSLCALKSLAKGKIDFDDIMQNFAKWYYDSEFTPTGYTFDIGLICMDAIKRYKCGVEPIKCGGSHEYDNGNGSLMRIHPFALYLYRKDMPIKEKIDIIHKASCLTHAHKRSQIACGIYAFVLWGILEENHISGAVEGLTKAIEFYRDEPEINHYIDRLDNLENKKREDINSSGYVVDTLEAALWCLLNTNSYKDCVLLAVNLGDDTDTIGAIAGSFAGALYGLKSIPSSWLNNLVKKDEIVKMCEQFIKGSVTISD